MAATTLLPAVRNIQDFLDGSWPPGGKSWKGTPPVPQLGVSPPCCCAPPTGVSGNPVFVKTCPRRNRGRGLSRHFRYLEPKTWRTTLLFLRRKHAEDEHHSVEIFPRVEHVPTVSRDRDAHARLQNLVRLERNPPTLPVPVRQQNEVRRHAVESNRATPIPLWVSDSPPDRALLVHLDTAGAPGNTKSYGCCRECFRALRRPGREARRRAPNAPRIGLSRKAIRREAARPQCANVPRPETWFCLPSVALGGQGPAATRRRRERGLRGFSAGRHDRCHSRQSRRLKRIRSEQPPR
jgi:hypothetical protein